MSQNKPSPTPEPDWELYRFNIERKDADRHMVEQNLAEDYSAIMRLIITLASAGIVAILFEGNVPGGTMSAYTLAAVILFILAVFFMLAAYVVSVCSLMRRAADLADFDKPRSEYRADLNPYQHLLVLMGGGTFSIGLIFILIRLITK